MNRTARRSLAGMLLAGIAIVAPTSPAFAGGLADVAKQVGGEALAGPLAAKFGVPAEAVSSLLASGVSPEGAVQALLVSQSSGKSLGEVERLMGATHDVGAAGQALGVDPTAYSPAKAQAVLADVQGQAAGAAGAAKAGAEASVGAATDAAAGQVDAAKGAAAGEVDAATAAGKGKADAAADDAAAGAKKALGF